MPAFPRLSVETLERCWVDDAMNLLLETEHGIGLVHDHDLTPLTEAFYDADGNKLTVAAISGHHNAHHPADREGPASLIDGNTATKWLDLNFTVNGGESYLIVEMQDGQPEPAAFQLYTNAQVAARRPAPLLSTPPRPLASLWSSPAL